MFLTEPNKHTRTVVHEEWWQLSEENIESASGQCGLGVNGLAEEIRAGGAGYSRD